MKFPPWWGSGYFLELHIGSPWTSRFSYWANNFHSFLSNEQGLSSERSKKWPLASKVQQLLPQRTSWNSGFFFEPCNQAVSFINLACFKFLFTFKVTCTPYCEITLNHVLHVFSHSSSSSSLYLQSVNGFSICIYSLIRDCPHLMLGYRHKMLLCSHFGYLIYDCVHSCTPFCPVRCYFEIWA